MNEEYFVSINDVAKRLDVPAHTLRYWEKQFPAAIRPTTGSGGRRYYRKETVVKLEKIKDLLYSRGMTIAGVKKMLHNGEFSEEMKSDSSDVFTPDEKDLIKQTVMAKLSKNDIDTAIDLLEQAKMLLN